MRPQPLRIIRRRSLKIRSKMPHRNPKRVSRRLIRQNRPNLRPPRQSRSTKLRQPRSSRNRKRRQLTQSRRRELRIATTTVVSRRAAARTRPRTQPNSKNLQSKVPMISSHGSFLSFHRISTNGTAARSEEHTSELQSLMRNSYAVFCIQTQTVVLRQNHNFICHTNIQGYDTSMQRQESLHARELPVRARH